MSLNPGVSIIVPLTGGTAQVERCFHGIAAQPDEPPFEVVVVDDASVGLSGLLGALEGDVRIVRSDARLGFAAAAQLGARAARASVAVLVRDSAEPSQGWLSPLVRALKNPSIGLAASVTTGRRSTHPLQAWSFALRVEHLLATDLSGLPGTLASGALALAVAERRLQIETVPESVITPPGARSFGARGLPGAPAELTIVIPTLDAASERVRVCIAAVQGTTDAAYEIVIVDNGCPPQGFTDPVNAGIRAAATPYVVVMNDDVEPLPGWWPPLRAALDDGAEVVFPMTVEGPMRRDFAAWCFAIGAAGIEALAHRPGQFFDPAFVIWYQDTDLLQRMRRRGRPPLLVEQSQIRHGLSETVGSDDPILRGWIVRQVALDREQFQRKHPDVSLNNVEVGAS